MLIFQWPELESWWLHFCPQVNHHRATKHSASSCNLPPRERPRTASVCLHWFWRTKERERTETFVPFALRTSENDSTHSCTQTVQRRLAQPHRTLSSSVTSKSNMKSLTTPKEKEKHIIRLLQEKKKETTWKWSVCYMMYTYFAFVMLPSSTTMGIRCLNKRLKRENEFLGNGKVNGVTCDCQPSWSGQRKWASFIACLSMANFVAPLFTPRWS